MSYALAFWKQKRPLQSPPVEVYRLLNSRRNMDGHVDLPAVAELPVPQILTRLKAVYPGLDPAAPVASFETPDGHYDVSWSNKHFSFLLNADLGDSLNPLIEIMREFGCPLFDPQQNKRYDTANGLAVGETPRFKSPTAKQKLERQKSYDAILSQTWPGTQLVQADKTRIVIKTVLATCLAIALFALVWYLAKS